MRKDRYFLDFFIEEPIKKCDHCNCSTQMYTWESHEVCEGFYYLYQNLRRIYKSDDYHKEQDIKALNLIFDRKDQYNVFKNPVNDCTEEDKFLRRLMACAYIAITRRPDDKLEADIRDDYYNTYQFVIAGKQPFIFLERGKDTDFVFDLLLNNDEEWFKVSRILLKDNYIYDYSYGFMAVDATVDREWAYACAEFFAWRYMRDGKGTGHPVFEYFPEFKSPCPAGGIRDIDWEKVCSDLGIEIQDDEQRRMYADCGGSNFKYKRHEVPWVAFGRAKFDNKTLKGDVK